MADFAGPDGKTDWAAYSKAQIVNGERCYQCGAYIVWGKGYQTLCDACIRLSTDRTEQPHDTLARCPHCGHTWEPYNDDGELWSEGEHSISCPICEKDFTIETHMSYSFVSPARIEEPEEDWETDEEEED